MFVVPLQTNEEQYSAALLKHWDKTLIKVQGESRLISLHDVLKTGELWLAEDIL